jgi:hypothetical protein
VVAVTAVAIEVASEEVVVEVVDLIVDLVVAVVSEVAEDNFHLQIKMKKKTLVICQGFWL